MNPNTLPERHTLGHAPNATTFMVDRDLDSHGFFLQPLLQRGFDVLDAGCGPGTISAGMAEAVLPGKVTAIDTDPARLANARQMAQGREIVNLNFVACSAYALPFANSSFDVVFANALLEHLREPSMALREFYRVTRPGGFVAVCSPDWDWLQLNPGSLAVHRAVQAYRDLLEAKGGNTRAGAHLANWLAASGFTPLTHNHWVERHESTPRIAEYLAAQLETAGQRHHATTLRRWSADASAEFCQTWKYAIGVRFDSEEE